MPHSAPARRVIETGGNPGQHGFFLSRDHKISSFLTGVSMIVARARGRIADSKSPPTHAFWAFQGPALEGRELETRRAPISRPRYVPPVISPAPRAARRSAMLASSRLASNNRYRGTVSSSRVIASPGRKAATAPQARIAYRGFL